MAIKTESALGAEGRVVDGRFFETKKGRYEICCDELHVRANKKLNGFVLFSPFAQDHFFRVYEEADGEREFTDYDPVDIEVIEIRELDTIFVETPNRRILCHEAWLKRRVPGERASRPVVDEKGQLIKNEDGRYRREFGIWNEDLEFEFEIT